MQLGKAIGILIRAEWIEDEMHADVDAWNAPSECHGDVSRGGKRRLRRARKHAEAVAGVPLRRIRHLARKRMGDDAPLYRRFGFVPY
jgi:hypothetical protein